MDQSTHDVCRASWLTIVNQCRQRPSDISVKQWLADNGIKEKAYYCYTNAPLRGKCNESIAIVV